MDERVRRHAELVVEHCTEPADDVPVAGACLEADGETIYRDGAFRLGEGT